MSYTPGPWENDNTRKIYEKHVIRVNGLIVATLPSDGSMMPLNEKHANARLIAAAPALVAALERIYEKAFLGNGNCAEIGNIARAAIHAAKGE